MSTERVEFVINTLLSEAGVARARQEETFETFPGSDENCKMVEDYVNCWRPGRNLVMTSELGCGKTGLIIAAMRVLAHNWIFIENYESVISGEAEVVVRARQRKPMVYRDATMMFSLIRAGFDDGTYRSLIQELTEPELLVIDDLAIERTSEWTREQLRMIVNQRYNARKSTWVTTNRSEDEFIDAIGEYTFWRLIEDGEIVTLDSVNIRANRS